MARKDKDKVLDTVSLVEILYSCEKIQPSVFHEALKRGFGVKTNDQKFGEIKPACLLVPLYCSSNEKFLEVLDDFESGRLKERLLEAFSQFRDEIKMMEIELMKMEEVNKMKDDIKRKLRDSTTHLKENQNLQAMRDEEFTEKFIKKLFVADVNGKNTDGVPGLHTAVIEGSVKIVKYLVEQGADVNGKNVAGTTVLHTAVFKGSLEMVKFLVENAADVNGKNTDGVPVLHTAVKEGTLEMVKYLVEQGADVNGKNTDGATVLHTAVMKGRLEIVKYLEEKRADLNGINNERVTVLHTAVAEGTLEMVKYLVEHGTDVNSKKTRGVTVLHTAVVQGTLEMVKYLVAHGADVNGKNTDGVTVLHTAVVQGTLEMVKYLVEHGADVNDKDTDGLTVLHVAVHTRALEIVKYLVEQGADITPKSEIGTHTLGIDILKMAIKENSVVLVNLLLEKNIALWRAGTFLVEGRQMSLLEWSIHLGHDEIATILKRSVNHREKIQMLKTMNCNRLQKTGIPMQAFVARHRFKIGDGSFSRVYVGIMKDGSEVAVKRTLILIGDKTDENENEITSLIKSDSCPFIVNCRHFYRDDTFMYLILDLYEENLRQFVESCSIEHLQKHGPRMIKEILSGLKFLHDKGILHRDLKPSNVLVDIEGRMKLGDFGISRILKDDETTVETFAKGTLGWMPPEVIEAIDRDEKGPFKRKSDVHVAGMISFYILTKGEHPFGSSLNRMNNILQGSPVNLKKFDDRNARRFVSWLINHRIKDRPYAHEALRNSFVNKA
ncbi:ankyrin-3-like [Dendronephthya gigantea]|uniref:ankyrin-3-like n=1 Tax=Dendronephthya gigantea TaxID=151771 RepID=UPI00106A5D05|nr:ankyrin-3-like [Dendronephthya gigantea]